MQMEQLPDVFLCHCQTPENKGENTHIRCNIMTVQYWLNTTSNTIKNESEKTTVHIYLSFHQNAGESHIEIQIL